MARKPKHKRQMRVLVVEDEHSIALQIAALLRSEGWTMMGPFGNLAQAIEKARAVDFDCAVLDVNLNGEPVDAVAAVLIEHGIPFVCIIDPRRDELPACCHDKLPVVAKPLQEADLLLALRCVLPLRQPWQTGRACPRRC